MRHRQWGCLTKTLGVVWPLLCAILTVSVLALIRMIFGTGFFLQLKEVLWWPSGVLAVAGSVAAGVFSTRDRERAKAAIAFAAWGAVVFYFAFCIHAVNTGLRQ